MDLTPGDYLTGPKISAGIFTGIDRMEVNKQQICFYKIFDIAKKITHYIPKDKLRNIKKLPSKETYYQYLKMMKDPRHIDIQELDGSRYLFFKHKLDTGSVKSTFEAVHDLKVLELQKKITIAERKLLNTAKGKLVNEISFVLELSPKEAETRISLTESILI
jgi:RNA polymerase-interacting CarD/CdnL/TRCF family regulator